MSLRVATKLAFAGLFRGDRTRVLAALAGVTVSIFVVVMHIAFLRGVAAKATAFYDLFDFDAVVVSEQFQFFYVMPPFPVGRAMQAAGLPSVDAVAQVRITNTDWLSMETMRGSTLIVFALTGRDDFIHDPGLLAAAKAVDRHGRVAADTRSDRELGPLRKGRNVKIAGRDATIATSYELGLRIYADGTALVTESDFSYYGGYPRDRISMALVKFRPGADRARAMAELATLPKDVRVLSREELRVGERSFFVDVKPLGVLMRTGMWIGLVVGLVALYQALATHLESRTREFAVLRAMGHPPGLIYAVGGLQLGILALVGAMLAAAVLVPVLAWLERLTTFDMAYGPVLWGYTLGASALLAGGSGLLALWRTQRMHPAELL